jgi:pimeloyl-ACP methyl ester carboxylesterase
MKMPEIREVLVCKPLKGVWSSRNTRISAGILYFLLLSFMFSSCSNDEKDPFEHFISSDEVATYSEITISSMLGFIAQAYPEVSELNEFINDGIRVSRFEYFTTINGQKIIASGLVAVPMAPGQYPAVSFQNGTNTLNSDCPSEAHGELFYQMVEFISSMGFIVFIPDYPGFGSSSDIPHPYLISEPTVQAITDMYRAFTESTGTEFPEIILKNEYYLLGYSQGGWATLTLHKEMELNMNEEFNLAGSVCGAGPYDMYSLFTHTMSLSVYPMPSYLGYIINAYSAYNEFTNRVTDLLNDPYASRLPSLYDGTRSLDAINSQLTTSIPGLFKQEFISGYATAPAFAPVREALQRNSIPAWNTTIPILMVHGESDSHVNVSTTNLMHNGMIEAGTPPERCIKTIFPGLDHGDAVLPCMIEGLKFIIGLRDN